MSDQIRYKFEDAVTEIAIDIVGTMAHRAFQEYGIKLTDDLQQKLVDTICFTSKVFGR